MLKLNTASIQHELVEYCRMNNEEVIEGTRLDRLHNYRRLIHTIFWESLADAYPITKSILNEEQWNCLVDDFISNNPCQEPQLFRMPFSLIAFVENNDYCEKFSLPFLIDLLHFEWVEIEVHTMEDLQEEPFETKTDFSTGNIVFNPYLRIIQLKYPIHKLKTEDISLVKGNYFLLVYRQDNGTVQYLELNVFTTNLLEQLCQYSAELTFNDSLEVIFSAVPSEYKSSINLEAKKFCTTLYNLGIIRGIRI